MALNQNNNMTFWRGTMINRTNSQSTLIIIITTSQTLSHRITKYMTL